ncbi:MAG: hypothetical protein BGO98_13495 [Myxococcales bacterium 68-20]|nr:hypothetical protein [Myxococcales bacterium]OJY17155.1 MAG: hypothetical protein BGO98_13495 [Myxococcales bacterium 68-20]
MSRKTLCLTTISVLVLAASCSDARNIGDYRAPASVPSFVEPDSGAEVSFEAGLTSYCPSNQCPAGWTTCPESFFPCDVDLKTDPLNCGACGASCPASTFNEHFSCVDGQCVMTCSFAGLQPRLDCDGVPDNGCETISGTNDNCGACGVKCPDPDYPCIMGKCGCPSGLTLCDLPPEWGFNLCLNTNSDDENCGACFNACDPAGDGGVRPDHMYFGCLKGECGQLKCEVGWANCDGLLANGCETPAGTDTDCAGCGDDCTARGQTCLRTPETQPKAYCGCEEGQTFCGECKSPGTVVVHGPDGDVTIPLPVECRGLCIDVTTDADNCGGCGLKCDGSCEHGSCVRHCPLGRADCDGNPDCEVNTLSDPQNCGGCGVVCNAIKGQACVRGQCVVAPCDDGDGGLAR